MHVFGDQLAAVRWEYLAIALGFFFVRIIFRAYAWRTILCAAYPDVRIRFRSVFGSYLAGVGVNSIVPARAGDAVKLYLVRHRIEGSTYATLTPTLVAETVLDMFVAGTLIGWALAIGALPTHQVYSRLPSVDWGFFIKHAKWTEIGLALVVGAVVIAIVAFIEHGGDARERVMRGFAIIHHPRRLVTGVVVPQAISWVFRIATVYYFLLAFRVHATIHNALLALVVDSLSTLFPATPGGAGTYSRPDRLPVPRRGDQQVAAARLQRRHEHRHRRLQRAARRLRDVHDGAHDLVAAAPPRRGSGAGGLASRRATIDVWCGAE